MSAKCSTKQFRLLATTSLLGLALAAAPLALSINWQGAGVALQTAHADSGEGGEHGGNDHGGNDHGGEHGGDDRGGDDHGAGEHSGGERGDHSGGAEDHSSDDSSAASDLLPSAQ